MLSNFSGVQQAVTSCMDAYYTYGNSTKRDIRFIKLYLSLDGHWGLQQINTRALDVLL